MNTTAPSGGAIMALAKIKPGANPRRYFDRRKHDELVASFRLRGVLQPILIRPAPDGDDAFAIVAGERRYNAALEAFGAEGEVPVIIREMTDQEALEAAVDENDCRDDTSETEQADAAVRILAASGGDRAEASKRLGWSQGKLDRRLALANLSDAVKLALDERHIKVGHAELLAAVPPDKQDKALDTIVNAGLDVAKTRELLMRVTQSLGAASFDKTECTTCPFNSASQRALFETHVDDGHCTNPGCFQLKTDAADTARVAEEESAAAAAKAAAPPPVDETPPAGKVGTSAPVPAPAPAPAAAAKPAKSAPATQTAKVTAKSIASRVTHLREAAWRKALIQACEGDPEFARAFEVILRDAWKVDRAFLGQFNKDELKFVAAECGLVEHMGAKPFAKLLGSTTDKIIDGMLNATGFDWAGRLPSSITLDGKYSPPLPAQNKD